MVLNSRWIQLQQFFHKLLIVAILALLAYSVSILMKPTANIDHLVSELKDQSRSSNLKAYTVKDIPSFRFYQTTINNRNPFKEFESEMSAKEIELTNALVTSDELPAHLRIVGVVKGNPSEVVLEDTKNNQSWFLVEGKLQEPFLLKRVEDNQIILKMDDELLTISLDQ